MIQTFFFVKPFPTRLVPSGTINIAANGTQLFLGTSARQERMKFIITNLDPTLAVVLCTNAKPAGVPFLTVFPQTSIQIENGQDIVVANQNGTPVAIQVLELYPGADGGLPYTAPAASASSPSGAGNGSGNRLVPASL